MSENSHLPSILRVPAGNVPDAINRGCAPRYSRNPLCGLGRVDALSRLPAGEHATERPPPGLLQLARFAVGARHRRGHLGHSASYGPKRHAPLTWPECARGDGAERGNPGLRCERRSHKWKKPRFPRAGAC